MTLTTELLKEKKWYNSGIRVSLVFVVICLLINSICYTLGININKYIGVGLIMCSIWQLVLTFTGHYK